VESSDIDLRGVLVEPAKYLYGLNGFEQFEDIPTDTVIFGLKKFASLCAAANPNALELLGVEESSVVVQTEAGKLLRENAGLFLSKRVIVSFGNYASAQLRRFCNAQCHDSYSEDEQERHLAATLHGQIDHFNRTYTSLGENGLRIYQDDTGALRMDLDLKGYPVRDFVGIYGEMHNTIRSYNKLNHRNRRKDDAHLHKHAMHLIRLLITGTDILDGKGIITRREAERDFLMDIRGGKYMFEQIKQLAGKYQEKFRLAAEKTQLPTEPDIARIERLMHKIYKMH
jgi:predicted nucleotidyltransferase